MKPLERGVFYLSETKLFAADRQCRVYSAHSMNLKMSFLVAVAGTVGSLYFSEVMKLPPCSLCWYQRIFLYSLMFVFGSALWSESREYKIYSFPLVIAGLAISIYHNLLYTGIISEALAPCTKEFSCTAKQLELFGFMSIPLMSMLGFLCIAILLVLDRSPKGAAVE